MKKKILLAAPRGFCAGVSRAIEIVERALEIYGAPIHVRHQIVHNNDVVRNLEAKGVIFVENIAEIPKGARVILSAHGSAPEVKIAALERGLNVIDATCPLVTKVHLEAKKYHQEGYSIILIGHRGHQEVRGTMGVAPMMLVESSADIENLSGINSEKVAYISQTTLSLDDTAEIVAVLQKRFPKIVTAPAGDICYATQNRQNAVKAFGKLCDLVFVIGAEHSSNSKRLKETAQKIGIRSFLVENASQIERSWIEKAETIGITAGASVPESLVKEVISYVCEQFPDTEVENFVYKEEKVIFPLPPEFRLQANV